MQVKIHNETYIGVATILCVLLEKAIAFPGRSFRFAVSHKWYLTIVATIVSAVAFYQTFDTMNSPSRWADIWFVLAIAAFLVAMIMPVGWFIQNQPSDEHLLGAKKLTH